MSNLFKQNYPTNQLSYGLYRYFIERDNPKKEQVNFDKPPKVFLSKIKKLLILDREFNKEQLGFYAYDYIFYESEGSGQGGEEKFSDFHVFLMGLAIECSNMGFKQREIIFFLFFTKWLAYGKMDVNMKNRNLKDIFTQIHKNHNQGIKQKVYYIIKKLEDDHLLYSKGNFSKIEENSSFLKPEVCYGESGLNKFLEQTDNFYSFISLELSHLVLNAPKIVKATKVQRRGRPAMNRI